MTPLSLSENKAIWRNSSALFNKENRSRDELNTLAFVAQKTSDRKISKTFRSGLDVVGMATDPGKAGKFLLWRHDRLPLPRDLLVDKNIEGRVVNAIGEADKLAEEMRQRFAMVARTLLMPEKLGGGSPDPEDVKNVVNKFDPRRAFWPPLENHFIELLGHLSEPDEEALKKWRQSIETTANECFAASCNALLLGGTTAAVVAVAQAYPLFSLEQINSRGSKTKAQFENLATE